MKKLRKFLALAMAAFMILGPIGVMAQDEMVEEAKEELPMPEEAKEKAVYLKYEGKIESVNMKVKDGKRVYSILVKTTRDGVQGGKIFILNHEVMVVNDKSKEIVSKPKFEVGMNVTGYYHKDKPKSMSIPPHITPDVLVINEVGASSTVKVTKFNKDLLSSDGSLILNIAEITKIMDRDGNKLKREDIVNKDLVAFYTTSTKGYPARALTETIILMK